eukprot:CAMPEP_0194347956 /NCGR_PEP_ID=MMETSP0171-20130528/106276_1 /TAXON_ID=218684 /ORGANISM="Corethron pennatum, Strain L29A3" /LENGTH=130 /DNA_ID=CAMNT_0039115259 /DNA_START=726 /DNA_END=1114 /DNA_ORIENTATION=+
MNIERNGREHGTVETVIIEFLPHRHNLCLGQCVNRKSGMFITRAEAAQEIQNILKHCPVAVDEDPPLLVRLQPLLLLAAEHRTEQRLGRRRPRRLQRAPRRREVPPADVQQHAVGGPYGDLRGKMGAFLL